MTPLMKITQAKPISPTFSRPQPGLERCLPGTAPPRVRIRTNWRTTTRTRIKTLEDKGEDEDKNELDKTRTSQGYKDEGKGELED